MRHSVHLHLPFHPHHRQARYDVDMTQGSITKHLINFSLPLLLGNLFQQLYNMVDTWVVGNYVSNEAFSAVGTVGPVINTLIGFFLGLSSGAGVVISQYYGAGREEKVRQAVHTALMLTLVLGVDQSTARGINLLFFLPASAICCGFRLRQRTLSLRKCFPAIVSGCTAAVLGSLAAASMDTSLLRKPFGILLLATGLRELLYRPQRRR